MGRTRSLWLGWAVTLYNGFQLLSGVVTGEVGGFGRLVDLDRAPSLDHEPIWYFGVMAVYLALTCLGAYLILNVDAASERGER